MGHKYSGGFVSYRKNGVKLKKVYIKFYKMMTEEETQAWIKRLQINNCLPSILDEPDHKLLQVEIQLTNFNKESR